MPSNDAKIYTALINHIEAAGYPYDVIEPGERFDPDPIEPCVLLDDLRFDNVRMYVGKGRHKVRGSFMANVMTPLDWPYKHRIEAAGVLAEYFPDQTTMIYGDVKLWTSKDAQVVNAGYVDGDHFRQTVSCPWEGLV